MYRERTTGEVLTAKEVQARFPQTMAAKPWKQAALDTFNVDPILPAPQPAASSVLHVVRKSAPVQDANGNWVTGWEEVDRFQTDEDGTKEEKDAAYLAKLAAQEKAEQLVIINKEFEEELAVVTSQYTRSEIDSWPEQLREAEAYQADNNASTPLINAAIAENGRTKADHVSRILVNAAAYRVLVGKALGKKQKRIADLDTP